MSDFQIDEAVAEYLDAEQRGRPLNSEEWLRQHSTIRTQLEKFLVDRSVFTRAAAPVEPPTIGIGEPLSDEPKTMIRYFGDYELLEEIARGGMGVVYKARQVSLNRIVALKMIIAGAMASPADVQRFRIEAEAAANLDHPNILPIYEVGEHDGQQYFSMKYVDGGTLAGVRSQGSGVRGQETGGRGQGSGDRKKSDGIGLRDLVQVLAQVARALHFAHQRGILHRDVKPGNILVAWGDGRHLEPDTRHLTPDSCPLTPFVADFGLAKRVEGDCNLTQTGAMVGTPGYMAPEQVRGEKQLTTAVDVWALGAMLYEVLTGRTPFTGSNPIDVAMAVLEKEPAAPSSIAKSVDRDLATIALKCLEKDPVRRYGSADALADDLDRWLNGEPIQARPATTMERLRKWARREPLAATLLTCVLVALIGALLAAASMVYFARQYANETERRAKIEGERWREAEAAAEKQKMLTQEAVGAKNETERVLYFNRIALAQQYWRADEIAQARQLLDTCPEKLRGWEWRYLRRIMHVESKELRVGFGYSATRINRRIHLTADGALMIPVSDRMSYVRVWDLKENPPEVIAMLPERERTGHVIRPNLDFNASSNDPDYVAATIAADGSCVAMGEKKGAVLLHFAKATGRKPIEIGKFADAPFSLSFSRDAKRLLATARMKLIVWDIVSGRELMARDGVLAGAFLPDGKTMLIAKRGAVLSGQLTIKLCDAETGAELRDLGSALDFAWSANDRLLALCEQTTLMATRLRVVDIASGQELLSAPLGYMRPSVALHPAGTHVVCRDQSDVIQVWNINERRLAHHLRGGPTLYAFDEFTPDGRLLTIGEGEYRYWDVSQSQEFQRKAPREQVQCGGVEFFQNGRKFATVERIMPTNRGVARLMLMFGKLDFTIRKVGEDGPIVKFPVSARDVVFFSIADNGERLAAVSEDGRISVIDARDGKPLVAWKCDVGRFDSVRISPDGEFIATALAPATESNDQKSKLNSAAGKNELIVWEAATGKKLWSTPSDERITSIEFCRHVPRLIVAGEKSIQSWNVETGQLMDQFDHGQKKRCTIVSMDPLGTSVLWAVCTDNSNAIFHLEWAGKKSRLMFPSVTSKYLAPMTQTFAAWSHDGKQFVSLAENGVKLWDCDSGQEIITLPVPDTQFSLLSVTFSPDGQRLHGIMTDGTQLTWDATPLSR